MKKYDVCFRNTSLKWSNPDFTAFLDEQKNSRLSVSKPSCFVIDGTHGSGKTTLAAHCGEYMEGLYGREFSYEDQVGKGMEKFLEKLNYVKKNGLHVVVYDEAEDFERKGAVSRLNRLLNRVFSVMRATGIMVIIVLGIVRKLEREPLDKGIVRALVNVHDRGVKYNSVRVFDAGNIYYLMYLMDRFVKQGRSPLSAYSKTMPVFRSRVLPADPDSARAWDLIDLKQKGDIMDTAALETKGLMDIKSVARESGYSISSLRVKFRSMKPEVVKIGRVNYYYRSVVDRLRQG